MNQFYKYQIASSLWARSGNNLNAMEQQLSSLKSQKEEFDKKKRNKKNKKEVPSEKMYYEKLISAIDKIELEIPKEQHVLNCVTPFKEKIEKKYFGI